MVINNPLILSMRCTGVTLFEAGPDLLIVLLEHLAQLERLVVVIGAFFDE